MKSLTRTEITLRSGAVVVFDSTHLKVTRNGLGKLSELNWTTPAGADRTLMWIDLDEIVAVVFVEER